MWLKVAKKNSRKKTAIIKLVANCNCGQAIVDKFPKLKKIVFFCEMLSHLTFPCSTLTIVTLGKGVKFIQS